MFSHMAPCVAAWVAPLRPLPLSPPGLVAEEAVLDAPSEPLEVELACVRWDDEG